MGIVLQLHEKIITVCPIHGVSIGRRDDKATWRIDFKDEATEQQRSAARVVLDAFDANQPDDPAKDIVDEIAALSPARRAALKTELAKP